MPKIIDDILNIFFYPDTHYDYASAMKLVRENLEAIIDYIVIQPCLAIHLGLLFAQA